MQLTHHRSRPSDNTGISFPLLECWNPLTRVATIAADVNKRRVLCRISLEVLQSKYRASPEEPMRAVAENRADIHATARQLITDDAFEEDGSILILR